MKSKLLPSVKTACLIHIPPHVLSSLFLLLQPPSPSCQQQLQQGLRAVNASEEQQPRAQYSIIFASAIMHKYSLCSGLS